MRRLRPHARGTRFARGATTAYNHGIIGNGARREDRVMATTARLSAIATLAVAAATAMPTLAQDGPLGQSKPPSLGDLLQQFEPQTPEPAGSVRLDAWVENGDAGSEVVVAIMPEGETKLIADPGITVTPAQRQGVEWLLPLPLRHVDPTREYFDPPAMVRLPFVASDGQPLDLVVEYAYCVIDYQCFFGEEALTVATAAP
jgi:hypothetical protein